jgi:hypothetical protein
MRVDEVLAFVDEVKPNVISDEVKITWLNTLERKIFHHLVMNYEHELDEEGNEPKEPHIGEEDKGTELIAPEEYADVYRYYLLAKIDFMNQDTDLYLNDAAMFNQAYTELCNYWSRTHKQLGPDHFEV